MTEVDTIPDEVLVAQVLAGTRPFTQVTYECDQAAVITHLCRTRQPKTVAMLLQIPLGTVKRLNRPGQATP